MDRWIGDTDGVRARFDFTCSEAGPIAFDRPEEVIVARAVDDVAPAMARVDAARGRGRWVAGWVAYEAAPAFDPALTTRPPGDVPLVCMGVFEAPAPAPPLEASREVDLPNWRPRITPDAHARGVAEIRRAIADGDTYQINYTFPLDADLAGADLEALYARLAGAARAPYAALVEEGAWAVLSLSPELFLRLEHGRLRTQPMKGTAARGRFSAEDAAAAAALRDSAKNRAENVMIVDLCRNDLTRVCEVGTVHVSSMFDVVRYPSVWQMVSTVEGVLRPDVGLSDVFGALFPAGSITGAPKSSSMRLIAALETAPRGVYCGAVGYASPGGDAVFNVAIRTLTVHRPTGRATYGVGGGITWDSKAGDEHAEALQKAACLHPAPPVSLIETMRMEQGVVVRLNRHLARLRDSAEYFGISVDEPAIRHALSPPRHPSTSPPRHLATSPPLRVRLILSAQGDVRVEASPLEVTPATPTVALAGEPVDASDVSLFHKTTQRQVYERAAAARPDAWDVLLWNAHGEVTEFTRGNVVVALDGALVTPPRACGLLAGVFRQALLDAGTIVERVVRVDDLPRADQIWFVNSLREWVEVRFADSR